MLKHGLFALIIFTTLTILIVLLPQFMWLFLGMLLLSILLYVIKLKFDLLHIFKKNREEQAEKLIYTQKNLEAYNQLLNVFDIKTPLPLTGGWAASADFLHLIVTKALEIKPEKLIECGSGLSTLFIAYALQRNRKGHLISLEHDPAYALKTKKMLEMHGLSEYVTIKTCDLISFSISGNDFMWYDYQAKDESYDFIVIDAPPYTTNSLARYPAGEFLMKNASKGAIAIIDDGKRPDETEMIKIWTRELTSWYFENISLEKGAFIGLRDDEKNH